MSDVWLMVNVIAISVLLIGIVSISRSPADRKLIPGLLLIGVGVVGFMLPQLRLIPPQRSFVARTLSLGIAIVGLVLVERAWKARRSSGSGHS